MVNLFVFAFRDFDEASLNSLNTLGLVSVGNCSTHEGNHGDDIFISDSLLYAFPRRALIVPSGRNVKAVLSQNYAIEEHNFLNCALPKKQLLLNPQNVVMTVLQVCNHDRIFRFRQLP